MIDELLTPVKSVPDKQNVERKCTVYGILMNRVGAFLGKWSLRSFYIATVLGVLLEILRDTILFGTTPDTKAWLSPMQTVMSLVTTLVLVVLFWIASTHRARHAIALLLWADTMFDAMLAVLHVEVVFNEWTLARDCMWLWALFLLAAGSPSKEETETLTYPSIERIP